MGIVDRIRKKYRETREKYRAKQKENKLLKTKDDEFVVNMLPAEEDNSKIDIHRVVKTMENPENMAEVVKNNLEELMKQDVVKDTLKHLQDEAVIDILQENKKDLEQQGKMALAIQAIDDPNKRLKIVEDNLRHLTPLETATVLKTVEEQRKEKKIENRKIKAASEQILRMLVQYGHISQVDIRELTLSLKEESSKLAIIKLCLAKINQYDIDKKKNITSRAKTKMVYEILKITNLTMEEKIKFLKESVQEEELLSGSECVDIKQDLEQENVRLEEEEKDRKARMSPKGEGEGKE